MRNDLIKAFWETIRFNIVNEQRNRIIELLAQIEVSIDYPEYDYEELENNESAKSMSICYISEESSKNKQTKEKKKLAAQ